jgi:uncharacterized protein YgiM (DUF1202 family)
MRRRFFLVTALSILAAGPVRAETRRVNSPGDGFLNLRSGPGTDFAILRRMLHGSRVEVLERAGAWLRVRHESGATGWASGRYLVSLAPAGTLIVADPQDGWLNLRSGPGSGFQIVTRMDNGTSVQVLERAGNWVRVRHQFGAVGWAYRPYLRAP